MRGNRLSGGLETASPENESENPPVPDGPLGYQRDDERLHPSGAGGRGSGNGQDGGNRVGTERAGEAEWSKGRKGKTEQEDVQSGLNGVRSWGSSL